MPKRVSAETANEAASARKATLACAAVTRPPSAGPIVSEKNWIVCINPLAAGKSSLEAVCGMRACEPGWNRPLPTPCSAASAATTHSGGSPTKSVTPSAPTTPARPISAISMMRRGPRRSASTPPSSRKSTRGSASAASTIAICRGSPVTTSTVQGNATPYAWSPSVEMSCPIKSNRKLRLRSGESGPARRVGAVVAAAGASSVSIACAPRSISMAIPLLSMSMRLLQRERHSHRVKFSWEVDTAHRSKE